LGGLLKILDRLGRFRRTALGCRLAQQPVRGALVRFDFPKPRECQLNRRRVDLLLFQQQVTTDGLISHAERFVRQLLDDL
jgi:hypothetical protein